MVVALVITMLRSRRHQEITRREILEEDALSSSRPEPLRLEQIHIVPENNDLSANTEREEENRMLLISEAESTLTTVTEAEEGIEIKFT